MARRSSRDEPALTHIDAKGDARMVDVSAKAATERTAVAEGRVVMSKATLALIVSGNAKKGDVLGTARVAGIMAAKRTSDLIPLCHPLALSKVTLHITPDKIGTYPVICTELCGLGHALMRSRVVVMDPTAFEQWAKTKATS